MWLSSPITSTACRRRQTSCRAALYHTSGFYKLSTAELLSLRTTSKIAGSPAFPNEFDRAWGWQQVGGPIIWNQAISTANVCLIDTGVDTAHSEFAGLTLTGYDYVNGDAIPNDDNGHGTHLAGIIMAKANNGAGTAIGIGSTKLVPVKAANAQGWGTSYNVVAGLTFLRRADHGQSDQSQPDQLRTLIRWCSTF